MMELDIFKSLAELIKPFGEEGAKRVFAKPSREGDAVISRVLRKDISYDFHG